MPQQRTAIDTRLSFPSNLAEKLKKMALHREMDIDKLIVELVEVGMMSLAPLPAEADGWARHGDVEHSTPGLPIK